MCNDNKSGLAETLGVIMVLQKNACVETSLDSCDRPMLGGGPNCLICNTRPVMLYTCGNGSTPWEMPTSKDQTSSSDGDENNNSVVFRVEKLDGNCCTFRVLAPNNDNNNSNPYVATNSLFTMDLGCLCAIRCLSDTYVECNL